jgi:hypothetical protein
VTAVRSPIIEGLVTVIVTSGITAPVLSVTRPLTAPLPGAVVCAKAFDAVTSTKTTEAYRCRGCR